MSTKLSEEPTLAEVISWAMETRLANTFVALPGRVEAYDNERQIADVQPLLEHNVQTSDGGALSEAIPLLRNVPIVFPRGGGFYLSFPMKVGDKVLLVFCDRNIDQYQRSNEPNKPVPPGDLLPNGPNGAVAYPGFFPDIEKLSADDADPENLIIGKDNGGIRIRVEDDTVNIQAGTTNPTDAAVLYDVLEKYWNTTFKPIFDAHIHPTGTGPSGITSTPVSDLDANAKSSKLKIGDN